MHIPSVLQRQPQRCPMPLLDAAAPTDEPGRLVGVKAVSASEDYFRGHFPGTPIMPGVLMIEAVTQAAVALLAYEPGVAEGTTIRLRGVDAAKFRRHVAPGDRLELDVRIVRRRGPWPVWRPWRPSKAPWRSKPHCCWWWNPGRRSSIRRRSCTPRP
ncbi:MAG: 3-hydroxyacyl-ACP dehydratase FabZ family protein [Vicinamibacterales bacterium]